MGMFFWQIGVLILHPFLLCTYLKSAKKIYAEIMKNYYAMDVIYVTLHEMRS